MTVAWMASVLASLPLFLLPVSARASWDESWLSMAAADDSQSNTAPLVAACGALAQATSPPASAQPTPRPEAAPRAAIESEIQFYNAGTDALDDGRWDEAISFFREVERMRGTRADRAIYWTAYAQSRLGRMTGALESIRRLKTEYPNSKWNKDAEALELELRAASGQKVTPEAAEDEDLKLMILNSLMSSDPDKAVPLVEKLLKGNNTERVKKQALFILSQSGTPQAMEILAGYAKGESDPELQRSAVEYIGLYGGSENAHLLEQIYLSSQSTDVRRKILEAYMLSGEGDRLLAVARKESQPELRRTAIEQLGLLSRTDALEQLYRTESDVELRRRIIESFMLAGDDERLYELARLEADPKLRRTAIEHLGLMGQTEQLWQLYTSETDVDLRRRILESFMLTGDSYHLSEVARGDKEPGLREKAIEQLGLLGESTFLHDLYSSESEPEIKKKIIEGLFLMGDDEALIEIARKENNRDLKRAAIEKLTLINSDEAAEFMMELLEK